MIRVFLGPMPELLHDLLAAAIDHEADMSTVSDLAVHEPLAGRVARARADVVILAGGDAETSALGTSLLDQFPWLRVLAIRPDGQQAWLHELEPVRTVLGEVTADAVVATIRARHRLPAEWEGRR